MPESHASDNLELDLDLGTVGDVAVATLNGRPLGTAWTPPHRFRITESVQPGPNRLEIAVTNTAAARVEQAEGAGPLDDELRERFGDFKKEYYSDGRRHIEGELKKDVPLPEAGLLGPVRIVAARRVRIPLD